MELICFNIQQGVPGQELNMMLLKIIRQFKLQAIREIKAWCCLQGITYCYCLQTQKGWIISDNYEVPGAERSDIPSDFCSLLLAGLACLGCDEL